MDQLPHKLSFTISSNSEILLWHKRLGHPSFSYLRRLYPSLIINNEKLVLQCEHCILAKQTHNTYLTHPHTPFKPFYLIHNDIWGPTRISSLFGARWIVTFIDDHTRVCWVYLMKEKFEVCAVFQIFHKLILNVFQSSICILRTDNGREYFSYTFTQIPYHTWDFSSKHLPLYYSTKWGG